MISVVVPAFNRAHLLGPTLESLLNQTVPAREIIVVDDGSTDDTAGMAESFGPSIRVIRQDNRGPGAARNAGFRAAAGEFIHFFDSDDVAMPNKHAAQLATLETFGADIACGPWIKGRFDANGFHPEDLVLQQHGLPTIDPIKALLSDWSIVPQACLFRRAIVEAAGGFPEDLKIAEDQLMFLRCLLAGGRLAHSPDTLTLYRTDGDDKLTTPKPHTLHRQLWDRAAFLCRARQDCLQHGFDPADWFGFRGRAWEADLDLRSHSPPAASGPASDSPVAELAAIHRGRSPSFLHRLHRAWRRKSSGLKSRVRGTRAHAHYRTGLLTSHQLTWIDSLPSQKSAGSRKSRPLPQ
ncbi:MAG: glycosyltransferase family 2 protein [Verrucomicrobiales bacterium]